MATFKILNSTGTYHTVEVRFSDQVFVQQLVSVQTGAKLNKQLQEYADVYEQDWKMLQSAIEE